MDTYSIKLKGEEVARISGEGITLGQKLVNVPGKWEQEVQPDEKLLKIVRDRKTIVVWYASSSVDVTVEKVDSFEDAAQGLAQSINDKIVESIGRAAALGLPTLPYPGKLGK